MDQKLLLSKLKDLWENKSILENNGPISPEGIAWLSEVRAFLELANPKLGADFEHYMKFIGLRLSSYTLEPLWAKMQSTLRVAIITIESSLSSKQERVYGPGDALEVYRDLSEIIKNSTEEVFIVDPYSNQEIFDLYLSKINDNVKIRLLTKEKSPALKALVAKFAAKPRTLIEARSFSDIHDRVIFIDSRDCWVIGQSIKDAAMKNPTYLLPVEAVTDMKKLYDSAWASATPF